MQQKVVDVSAHNVSPALGRSNQQATGAHKRVKHQVPRANPTQVGHDHGQAGIHACIGWKTTQSTSVLSDMFSVN